jgi:transposase InsO family protein
MLEALRAWQRKVKKVDAIYCIKVKIKLNFVVTTDSNHRFEVVDNLVSRDFHVEQLKQVWTGDNKYLNTDEGWVFLAFVIELFNRQIIGWSMSPR